MVDDASEPTDPESEARRLKKIAEAYEAQVKARAPFLREKRGQ